jgi:hypothetical protein
MKNAHLGKRVENCHKESYWKWNKIRFAWEEILSEITIIFTERIGKENFTQLEFNIPECPHSFKIWLSKKMHKQKICQPIACAFYEFIIN